MTSATTQPAGTDDPALATAVQVLDLIGSSWISKAIATAAELRIPDLIGTGCRTAEDLAVAAGCNRDALLRLLRGLVSLGLCTEAGGEAFRLTAGGRLLREDDPASVRCWALWWGRHLWPVWADLTDSVRTGHSARRLRAGTSGYTHVEREPAAAAVFNGAMAELTRLAAAEVMRVVDFSRACRVVDVGGGQGELLARLLHAHPGLHGTLFDLPHAVEPATRRFREEGLAGRCACVAGDFFAEIPGGADIYLLKSILHNWDDGRCAALLASCRRALGAASTLVLVERMRPAHAADTPVDRALSRTDLNMLVGLGGRERSQAEFTALLAGAGFDRIRFRPTRLEYWVIEASPAAGDVAPG